MATLQSQKQEVFDYVKAFLGGGMVDVELDPIHYETALKKALSKFRQRSDNSVEESYLFLNTIPDVNEYTLANEVIEVRKIFRRSIGSRPSTSASGGPIFTQTFTATPSQLSTFDVNYNLASVQTVIVQVNGEDRADYAVDS